MSKTGAVTVFLTFALELSRRVEECSKLEVSRLSESLGSSLNAAGTHGRRRSVTKERTGPSGKDSGSELLPVFEV